MFVVCSISDEAWRGGNSASLSPSSRPCAGIHCAAGREAGGGDASRAARWTPEQVRGDEEAGSRGGAEGAEARRGRMRRSHFISSSSRPCAGIHCAAGREAGGGGASRAARWAPEQVRSDEEEWFTRRREGAEKKGFAQRRGGAERQIRRSYPMPPSSRPLRLPARQALRTGLCRDPPGGGRCGWRRWCIAGGAVDPGTGPG